MPASIPSNDASPHEQIIALALDRLRIELPSWGFADTGTRFGKFFQPAAAATIEEKFAALENDGSVDSERIAAWAERLSRVETVHTFEAM
jgi:hypothetical protein